MQVSQPIQEKYPVKIMEVVQNDISALAWCPVKDFLATASWGGECKIWDVKGPIQNIQYQLYPKILKTTSPILSMCWAPDRVFVGNVDGTIQMHAVGAPTEFENLGDATNCVRCLKYSNQKSIVISGGYDKKIKFWDWKSKQKVFEIDLPERVYGMDISPDENMLVVGLAGKMIRIYDLRNPQTNMIQHESTLSHQIRCISCFGDQGGGWATGTIEGRMRINYFHEYLTPQTTGNTKEKKASFSFKCHRDQSSKNDPNPKIYTINDISFHPKLPWFASAGSDGTIMFWDKNEKQKLKTLGSSNIPNWGGLPCTACAFSKVDGNFFAFSTGYDWSRGSAGKPPTQGSELKIVASEIMKEKEK